jgi:hypothetical protein
MSKNTFNGFLVFILIYLPIFHERVLTANMEPPSDAI